MPGFLPYALVWFHLCPALVCECEGSQHAVASVAVMVDPLKGLFTALLLDRARMGGFFKGYAMSRVLLILDS